MQTAEYLNALRRLWYVPLLLGALGALVGWFTAPEAEAGTVRTYFRATHTLLSRSAETDINRTAFLVTIGDVPGRVGRRLGEDPLELARQIQSRANAQLGTIEIVTVQDTPGRAVRIADAFAEELQAHLEGQARAGQAEGLADVLADVAELRRQIDVLDARLARGEGDTVQAERDATIDRYRLAYERLQNLTEESEPSSGVVTLQAAEAVETRSDELPPLVKTTDRSGRSEGPTVFGGGGGEERNIGERSAAPDPTSRSLAGGLAGFFLGAGITLLLDRFDKKVRDRGDAEDLYGVPVVTAVPPEARRRRRAGELTVSARPYSAAADAYRRLRSTLEIVTLAPAPPVPSTGGQENGLEPAPAGAMERDGEHGEGLGRGEGASRDGERRKKVLLVTSAEPGEGKTTVVANLAAAFAEAGLRVLVCDGDFRRPRVHELLRPRTDRALTAHGASPQLNQVATATSLERVWLVRSALGRGRMVNPTETLASQRSIVEAARPHADVILIDTAPLLVANDANDLLPVADGVLVVARVGLTAHDRALRARGLLELVGAPIVGVVLIGANERSYDQYYDERSRHAKPTERRWGKRAPVSGPAGEDGATRAELRPGVMVTGGTAVAPASTAPDPAVPEPAAKRRGLRGVVPATTGRPLPTGAVPSEPSPTPGTVAPDDGARQKQRSRFRRGR